MARVTVSGVRSPAVSRNFKAGLSIGDRTVAANSTSLGITNYVATVQVPPTSTIVNAIAVNLSTTTYSASFNTIDPSAYYVAKTGNDTTGDGSVGSPWLTIQKGLDTLTSGEHLYVKAGTYTESRLQNESTGLHAGISGTSGNHTIYEAYPGDLVIIDQLSTTNGWTIHNKDYITIKGFEIKNTYWTISADKIGGIFVRDSSNILIENCHIHHCDGQAGGNTGGVRTDWSNDVIVRNCDIHDITVGGVDNGNASCLHGYGQYSITVENCDLYNAHSGIFHKRSLDNIQPGYTVSKCVIHDVTNGFYASISGGGSPGHGAHVFSQNIVYDATNGFYQNANGTNDNASITVTNNVFDNISGVGIWARQTASTTEHSNIIFNSTLSYSEAYEGTTTITETDYNDFFGNNSFVTDLYGGSQTVYSTLAAWQGAGYDTNSIQSDPSFVNAASRDYHLQGGSPCLGTGKSGANMGCYITGSEDIGTY